MRRSAAPSQGSQAKRPRFNVPFKTPCQVNCEKKSNTKERWEIKESIKYLTIDELTCLISYFARSMLLIKFIKILYIGGELHSI